MSLIRIIAILACTLALGVSMLLAQTPEAGTKINVLKGPAKAQLKNIAQINVPTGYIFFDGKTTQAFWKSRGEPITGRELGMLVATNEDWSVLFEFNDMGYVKDDDKNELDPDKLLDAIKKGTAADNEERRKAGHPPLEVVGWEVPPKYDAQTHNLEWAIRATSAGQPILNYNTRLLGRKGVMEVILIIEPDKLQATLPTFRSLLAGYSFGAGQTYAEFRAGDKVAKYGLGALVLGGGAVAAAKLGLFAWLLVLFKKAWKLVIVAFAAVAAFFKKLFSGRRANPNSGPVT